MNSQLDLPLEIPPTQKEQRRNKWKELNKILGFQAPLDGLICAITKELTIDVVKLDGRLQVPNGQSLANYLTENYGQRANELVSQLI